MNRKQSAISSQQSVEEDPTPTRQARSIWDIVNGVTAYARSIPHTNDRVALETKAGELMKFATA